MSKIRRPMSYRSGAAIVLVCAVLITGSMTGCGGSSTPPAPPTPPPPRKTAGPIVPVKKATPGTAAMRTPVADTKPDQQTPSNIPEGTDPADIFTVITEPSVYDILGPGREIDPADHLRISPPVAGRNSSYFEIVYQPSVRTFGNRDPQFQLPQSFEVLQNEGYAEDGRPWRIRSIPDEMIMAYVPGGELMMGTESGSDDAMPPLKVVLDPFYIDITEVTLKSYKKYRDYLASQKKRVPQSPSNEESPENHPVLGISWTDANGYASILGKALPTEAQWELAARGPASLNHPWGNDRAIWPHGRALDEISPVGSFPGDLSFYGLYDTAGNAREWCLDWYSDKAYQEEARSAKGQAIKNYTGPRRASEPYHRVGKGNGKDWMLWQRWALNMRERYDDVGFRTVYKVSPVEKLDPKQQTPETNQPKIPGF